MKPALQITVDATEMSDAIQIACESVSINGVELIAIGKTLIKSKSIQVIKEFKKNFPEKRIVVDIDVIGRSRKLKSVIDAGADVLLVSGNTPPTSIEKIINEFGKSEIELMIDLTQVPVAKDVAKKLDFMDVDYFLVGADELTSLADSVITPIAVDIGSDKGKVVEVLGKGAEFISVNPVKDAEGIREILDIINKSEEEKPERNQHVCVEDEYVRDVTTNLDSIKRMLSKLETQKATDEECKLHMEKRMREMEGRFSGILKKEQKKIEKEREFLVEQMAAIKEEWNKLRREEDLFEKKKKKLEEENQKKWENMLKNMENEILKRIEEKDIKKEEFGIKIEGELREIKKEWEDMEDMWKRIEEDKSQIEEKKKEIASEWEKIGEITEKKEEKKDLQEKNSLGEEFAEIEQEWEEIEEVWTKIDIDKHAIEEKREEIEKEWESIKTIKKDIQEDQEKIRNQLEEIEKLKKSITIDLPPQTGAEEIQVREDNEDLQKERSDIDARKKELEDAEARLATEKDKLKDEIRRLEEEWRNIKEMKKDWGEEEKIKKKMNKALADLDKLKKEHEKPIEKDDNNQQDTHTKEMINRLIDLVGEKKEIKLKDAAKELDAQEYLVKRWSSLLEKKKIVEVKTPLLGDVVLKRGANMEKLSKNPDASK